MLQSRGLIFKLPVLLTGLCLCAPPVAADDTIRDTFISGSGASKMILLTSVDGNLIGFESPAGFEHIREGSFNEGYILTDSTGATYFDVGFNEGGFGPSVITQPNGLNTFPLTIVRNTTDGRYQLKQSFARDTTNLGMTITMTVVNLSTVSRSGIKLERLCDFDIDSAFNGFVGPFARTEDSAFAWQNGAGHHGLMLFATSLTTAHHTSIVANFNGNIDPASDPSPQNYDGEVAVTYVIGTLGAGKNKTVKVKYTRL